MDTRYCLKCYEVTSHYRIYNRETDRIEWHCQDCDGLHTIDPYTTGKKGTSSASPAGPSYEWRQGAFRF